VAAVAAVPVVVLLTLAEVAAVGQRQVVAELPRLPVRIQRQAAVLQ
jgi:hypothetical protein